MESFLFQATIYLGASVIAVPIAARLGLGSVLGYLLAGIAIGPLLGLVGSETASLQHFAEFGVVMMLFLIGLELEPRALWDMRHKLLGFGGAQIGLTIAAVFAGALFFGLPWQTSLAIGMIFALSSTAIVLQTLDEKALMQTGGGRASFSVLLTQDIAVIPMLVAIPLLAMPWLYGPGAADEHGGDAHGETDGHGEAALSLVEGLLGWGVTLVTLGAIGIVVLLGIFAFRPLFRFIHAAHLREMYTATALLIVVGIAVLMIMVGLSPALGTFLAGVLLASSEFRHELESDIEPFKGLLLGLFFITVGAGINFGVLLGDPFTIIGLTLLLMLTKGTVLFSIALAFKLRGRDRWLFTLGLAQAGEFGFVLISFSLQQSVLPGPLGESLLLVVALSMLLTPLFFIAYEVISRRMADTGDETPHDEIDESQPIIIAGVGRFGQVVNRMLQTTGFKTTVLDHNLKTIELMRQFGFNAFFGDPTRPELLRSAGLANARVLVVAVDDKEAAIKLVKHARTERPDLHIIARAYDRVHTYRLYQAGANDIVREMFDSSLRAGRYALEHLGFSEYEASEAQRLFYHGDRNALAELAPLWNPDIPVVQNTEYIERAKELNKELETGFLTQISEKPKTGTAS
ncbi:MAG: potassium transporter [Rhodobacteraceae bacterium]|nr:potassium transporter [Paracoccaceae bacterium]